ncbi:hypothetical protein AVEN_142852-1 [Araneus ventricosus]|uniref:Uncharacterized protein n=1 Tax=Araneus ventricosus TaxID=182803 RepID=A0A4Y2MFL9_ARAVE|nr:hypothetical protein AVEN_142852-1 [Araneus ventricosus]
MGNRSRPPTAYRKIGARTVNGRYMCGNVASSQNSGNAKNNQDPEDEDIDCEWIEDERLNDFYLYNNHRVSSTQRIVSSSKAGVRIARFPPCIIPAAA